MRPRAGRLAAYPPRPLLCRDGQAIYGRRGATYLDLPDHIIIGKCDESKVVQVERAPDPPRTVAPEQNVEAALNLLERAERPLVLVGKGK